jgi:hypothetical protein
MKLSVLLALFLFIGLATSQSFMCGRTATVETWCNDDGSRTAVLGQTFIQNSLGQYVPMTEAAKLEYTNNQFVFSYSNWSFSIQPFVIYNGQFKSIQDIQAAFPNVNVSKYISVGKNNYKFAINFSGVPQSLLNKTDYVGLRLVDSQNLTWDDVNRDGSSIVIKNQFVISYQDLLDSGFTLNLVNKTYLLIGNISNNSNGGIIFLDPTITLNESNKGNVGDTKVYQGGVSTNYGTWSNMSTSPAVNFVERLFILINNSYGAIPPAANITSVTLSLYLYYGLGTTRTLWAYNTSLSNGSALWNETNIVWNTQPSAGTLQDSQATGTTNGVWITWNITNAFLASWSQTVPNNVSILIKDSNEGTGTTGPFFSTKENATTANRPQVYVVYMIPSCAAGLVGYWKFDENTGTYAFDSSLCEADTGTLVNSPTWGLGKNYQTPYALSFTGTNQYVNVSNSSVLNPTQSMTISAWVNPTVIVANSHGWYYVIYRGKTDGLGAHEYDLGFETWNNAWTFRIANTSGTSTSCIYATTPTTNTWYHLAGVANSTTETLYLNGVQVAQCAFVNSGFFQSTNTTRIGGYGAEAWNGTIDEVKIWNKSLSASEVMSEYTHYCPLYPISITAWNESATSQYLNSFTMVASNTTSSFTYTTGPIYNVSFGDYYCNSSFPIGATTISISNTSFYSPRYYLPTITYGGSYSLNAYLLPYSDIGYMQTTILIKNELGNTVPGAVVTIQKMISGTYTTVAQDAVDGVGQVFFTLDKNTNYYLIAAASGYDTTTLYFQPSQSLYTVTLYGGVNYNIWDNSTSGIYWNVTPGSYMLTGLQNFNFSILDANTSLAFWGMSINYNGTQLYFSNQTASAGGSVNYSINISNYPGYINMTIFFKRVNGTFFDPTYHYWGYSIVASTNSLVNAMANVGSSDLSPLTKSLTALVVITLLVGYVGSQNFTGGVLLAVVMMWGFASFGFLAANIVSMLTIIGIGIIILKYFPTG